MRLLAPALAAILACAPLIAQADIAMTVPPQAASPVQIDGCYATQGGQEMRPGRTWIHYRGGLAIAFHEKGPKTVTSVVFRFDGYERDDGYRTSVFHIIDGTFAPGAEIDDGHALNPTDGPPVGMWAIEGFGALTTQISCSVETVQFADGTIWRQDPHLDLRCVVLREPYGFCDVVQP